MSSEFERPDMDKRQFRRLAREVLRRKDGEGPTREAIHLTGDPKIDGAALLESLADLFGGDLEGAERSTVAL